VGASCQHNREGGQRRSGGQLSRPDVKENRRSGNGECWGQQTLCHRKRRNPDRRFDHGHGQWSYGESLARRAKGKGELIGKLELETPIEG
jgi:hypothetical protein